MNLLARVKSKNRYNYITDNLYKEVPLEEIDEEIVETPEENIEQMSEDEETIETITVPITDIDGETALLTTDGTSWQLTDGEWVRIEQDLDVSISENIYPFISSICQTIHNGFIQYPKVELYDDVVPEYKDDKENIIVLKDIENSIFVKGDFVHIVQSDMSYLSRVLEYKNNTLELDNLGVGLRVTGDVVPTALALVIFPPTFLSATLDMLGYDYFMRDAKEKRQERLGNYTYTNFDPVVYNGEGAYPKQLENAVKYWQRVYM